MEKRIYITSSQEGSLRQGEIITDLVQMKLDVETINADLPTFDKCTHPFAIIVSQDCDLDIDFKARNNEIEGSPEQKLLPEILFCQIVEAKQLRGREDINSTLWARIKYNNDERYHFLEQVAAEDDNLGEGLSELGIDFKRYFTIPTDEVYTRLNAGEFNRRCRLVSPYLEHFTTRFAHYLSRIALPSPHYSQPVN